MGTPTPFHIIACMCLDHYIMSDNAYSDIICKFKKESEAKRISPPSLPSKINSKQLRASMCMYVAHVVYVTMCYTYTLYVTITNIRLYYYVLTIKKYKRPKLLAKNHS